MPSVAGVRGVGEADLVVLVVGVAPPVSDRVDARCRRPILALACQLVLVGIDAGAMAFAVGAGNGIEVVVPGVGDAGKAAEEKVRPAHRLFVGTRPRVRLPSVEAAGLRRERKLRRIGRDEIGIARHAVIVGPAAEGVGVEGEVAGAGIEQHAALAAVVDARHGAPALRPLVQPRWP